MRTNGKTHPTAAAGLAILLAIGCRGEATNDGVSTVTGAITGDPASLTISLPDNMVPQSTPLAATRSLQVRDRARAKTRTGASATVVNTGATQTYLGVEARTGNIWSGATVTLSPRARVEGFVKSAGNVVLGADAVVTGAIQENASIPPLRQSTWQPVIPAPGANVDIEPDQSVTLAPGGYRRLNVKSRSTAKLSAGTYAFDDMFLEPQSTLEIDDSAGVVVIYARMNLTFRGKVIRMSDPASSDVQLLIVALGTSAVIEAPFRGTVFAPNATMLLQPLNNTGEHYGAFFGKDVTVEAGVVVNHRFFFWSKLLPPTPVTMGDGPVTLKPGKGGPGGGTDTVLVETPSPVTFQIPRDIWVGTGNAGNGKVELSFRAPGGTTRICTYTGGSPVAAPTTALAIAKGRRYTFPSCTNGLQHGQTVTANWFQLRVVSAATNFPTTTVTLTLGGGCNDSIQAPMTPEEVVAVRENFDWQTMGTLPEIDSEGRPSLWHGLIYIERREQLAALDRWKVFWSGIPLSGRYQEQMAGKCGRVEHASDGMGTVVYAVFPGKLFNILRAFAVEAQAAGVAPPFKFIAPSTPDEPAHVNPDGSIKHSALASSGYGEWLASRPPQQPFTFGDLVNFAGEVISDLFEAGGDAVEAGFSWVGSAFDDAVDWVANALDNTWETIQGSLGAGLGLVGTVPVTIDLRMGNRDPAFAPNSGLVRAWGPSLPDGSRLPIGPWNAFVTIRQWGLGFLPVLSQRRLPTSGVVTIDVPIADPRNGDGLCVELENDYVMMSTDVFPNEVCNFAGAQFDNFLFDTNKTVTVRQKDLHAFTLATDGGEYVRHVMGWDHPRQMAVLIGWEANSVSALINDTRAALSPFAEGDSRAMCLCLDFPSVAKSGLTFLVGGLANAALGAFVGGLSDSIILKDLWWPDDNAPTADSRGVMVHEYGHFAMCNLLWEKGGAGALTPLIGRIIEGGDARSDSTTLVTESWADTFAMQVAGGVNYLRPHHSTNQDTVGPNGKPLGLSAKMGFCTAPTLSDPPGTASHCMEWNYQGGADYFDTSPFKQELAQLESTIHDAFDVSDSARRATLLQPSNGDVWGFHIFGGLAFNPTPYIAVADEPVSLGGVRWQTWVDKWLQRGGEPNYRQYLGGLSDAMIEQGHNWCERCEVFAIHDIALGAPGPVGDPTLYVPATFTDRLLRWQICTATTPIPDIIGPPTDILGTAAPYLTMGADCRACPPLQFPEQLNPPLQMATICTPCPAGHIARGMGCVACPTGTVPDPATNECTTCAPNQISQGGACQPCLDEQTADRATNTCVLCPADVVVDFATNPACGHTRPIPTGVETQEDICPGRFFVELRNMSAVAPCGGVTVNLAPTGPITQNACPNMTAVLRSFGPGPSFPGLSIQGSIGTWVPIQGCPPTGPCIDASFCDFSTGMTFDANQINGGFDSVRFRTNTNDDSGVESTPVPGTLTVVTSAAQQ